MADTNMRPKPIILIVDDIPKNIQVLGTLLNSCECEIAVAMNGKQAYDTACKILPDLILLDIMMPVMDGLETCRILKENPDTKNIPVIFLSAKSDTADIVAGFELGAVDYVTKPFIGKELLARVKTHLTLRKVRLTLNEELDSKNKFFSILSHDLRSAFGNIANLANLLTESLADISKEELEEFLTAIAKTSQNTLDLLEDLLNWARTQTGTIKFNPEKIELNDLLPEMVSQLKNQAKSKNIELSASISTPYQVFADRNMLRLVLRNLITNAIKFTNPNGFIKLKANPINDTIRIEVQDNGIGISKSRIQQIFNLQKSSSTAGTNKEQGHGLGLILCKEFIERNQGHIGVESEPGKGSTFWVTLPMA